MATTGHESEIIQVLGLKAAMKDGGNKGIFNEATCSTAAGTAAKTVDAPKAFSLVSGATIIVKFVNAISVASATLNVGSTGAKPIYYHGTALEANKVSAGDRLIFRYNGTLYDVLGQLNTTYSAGTAALLTDGTNTTNRIWQAKIIADYVKATAAATASPANGGNAATVNNHSVAADVPSDAVFTDTTYESKSAVSSGTDVSLVTTGEKYTWNNKQDVLTFNSTPSPSNKVATMADIPSTLPASDVSSWAKQSSKPSYAYSEIGYVVSISSSAGGTLSLDGTTPLHIVTLTGNISALTLSANPTDGHSCHIIFTAASQLTIAIAHDSTSRVCPGAEDLSFTVPEGGYTEIDFLSANNKVYVRGV